MTALARASRSLTQPAALPLVLLLGALSSTFFFGHDRGHFYRDGVHDWMSSQGLSQAVNLSPADGLLLFINRTHDVDGDLTYSTYARWPIGSYALVKLATLPFDGDLSATIYAARFTNLLLFAATAILAFLAFARLVGPWVALTATLLAFSSEFALYYSDAFAPDGIPALLGLLLTFHGMVLFVQEGRFVQLLAKSCVALLLCWQPYGLLLPFVVLGLLQDLFRGSDVPSWRAIRKRVKVVLCTSRHLQLGLATLGFGTTLLCFNLANEYLALNGKVSVTDLPTIYSLGYRLGQDDFFNNQWAEALAWPNYIGEQFRRIVVMTLPFYASVEGGFDAFGFPLMAYCCIGLAVLRHPTVFVSLLLAGFVWAFALRHHVAIHEHQSLFHIGIPLVAIAFAGTLLNKHLVYAAAGLAVLAFVLSSVKMAGVGHDLAQAQREDEMLREFQTIRRIVGEKTVFIAARQTDDGLGGAPLASSYFMAGSVVEFIQFRFGGPSDALIGGRFDLADYFISDKRLDVPSLITPENKRIFLYDRTCDSACRETILTRFSGSDEQSWDAYLEDGSVVLVSEDCTNVDMVFFIQYTTAISPSQDSDDAQDHMKGANFTYEDRQLDSRDQCAVKFVLPDHQVQHIRVGQRTEDHQIIWSSDAFVFQ